MLKNQIKAGMRVKIKLPNSSCSTNYTDIVGPVFGVVLGSNTRGNPPICIDFEKNYDFTHSNYLEPSRSDYHSGVENKNNKVYFYFYPEELESASKELDINFDD
jgi:hypothetical protein